MTTKKEITPGQWQCSELVRGGEAPHFRIETRDQWIASVYAVSREPLDVAEAEANANLIAAAPAMMEACKALVSTILNTGGVEGSGVTEDPEWVDLRDAYEKAREAIILAGQRQEPRDASSPRATSKPAPKHDSCHQSLLHEQKVLENLHRIGLQASLEYPGYLDIPLNAAGWTLACGTANGAWDCNYCDPKGESTFGEPVEDDDGEQYHESSTDYAGIANGILELVHKFRETLSKEEGQQ